MRSQRVGNGDYRLEFGLEDGFLAEIQRRESQDVLREFAPVVARSERLGAGERYHAWRAHFHARYPDAFPARGCPCAPLKIGIHQDLIDRGEHVTAVKRFLGAWTKRWEYLEKVVAGAERIDLEGEPAGTVTPGDEAQARAEVAHKAQRRNGIRAARRYAAAA